MILNRLYAKANNESAADSEKGKDLPRGLQLVLLQQIKEKKNKMKYLIHVFFVILFGTFPIFAQPGDMTAYMGVNWSPDGKYLAFTLAEMKMGPPRSVKAGNGHNFFPAWSADGKKVIFSGFREANPDPAKDKAVLYLMNADGSDIKLFGNIQGSEARFSTDGKKVVFIGGDRPTMGIYVASADGTNVKKIHGI